MSSTRARDAGSACGAASAGRAPAPRGRIEDSFRAKSRAPPSAMRDVKISGSARAPAGRPAARATNAPAIRRGRWAEPCVCARVCARACACVCACGLICTEGEFGTSSNDSSRWPRSGVTYGMTDKIDYVKSRKIGFHDSSEPSAGQSRWPRSGGVGGGGSARGASRPASRGEDPPGLATRRHSRAGRRPPARRGGGEGRSGHCRFQPLLQWKRTR